MDQLSGQPVHPRKLPLKRSVVFEKRGRVGLSGLPPGIQLPGHFPLHPDPDPIWVQFLFLVFRIDIKANKDKAKARKIDAMKIKTYSMISGIGLSHSYQIGYFLTVYGMISGKYAG